MDVVDAALLPSLQALAADAGGLELLDAHTHIGFNDPDGFSQRPESLLAELQVARARAVVFPMHEPEGYRAANDAVLAAAEASAGTLTAFCRVDPARGAAAEARRCLDAGAAGIKLHPRAESFTLAHPGVREVVALAHERTVPVLIHAGRGIPALGEDTIRFAREFPRARLILAHCAISDLAWLWKVLPEHPNVFVDTSWWNPVDIVALFSLVPPGQILWASDSPYGRAVPGAFSTLRCARQARVGDDALRAVAGGQMARLLAGEEPLDVGPAPGPPPPLHPLVERVVVHLATAMSRAVARADPEEPIGLGRLACAVGDGAPYADVLGAVLRLLDGLDEHAAIPPTEGRPFPPASRFLSAALAVARTPDVPLGPLAPAAAPTREHAADSAAA